MSINALYTNELEMMESLENITEETKARFQVLDLSSLTWTLRKMAAIEAKKQEINTMIEQEMERLTSFRNKEMKSLEQSEDFLRGLISEYAIKKRDEDPKFKSEKTPYGSIGFRKQQPKWNYDDEALVTYLEQNDYSQLVRTKKEPVKTEIKKLFKPNDDGRVFDDNGQEVTGIMVEFVPETLDIKVEV